MHIGRSSTSDFWQKHGATAMARPDSQSRRIVDLPAELVLLILQFLPDSRSLKMAALAHRGFNDVIAGYKNVLYTSVVRNELGCQTFLHAVVSYMLARHARSSHGYQTLDSPGPGRCLELVHGARQVAEKKSLPASVAIRLLNRHQKTRELCELLVGPSSPMTNLPAFQGFGSSRSEADRVQRALYLYDMVASLCKEQGGLCLLPKAKTKDVLEEFCKVLLREVLAPWELQQIVAIQWYLGRALLRSCTSALRVRHEGSS